MRIYNREDFFKLPIGTMFHEGKPFVFFDLQILKEVLCDENDRPIDYYAQSLCTIESHSSEQLVDRQDEMLEKMASYPLNKDIGRDGCYDDRAIYLVYEKEDLEYLLEKINEALAILSPEAKEFLEKSGVVINVKGNSGISNDNCIKNLLRLREKDERE